LVAYVRVLHDLTPWHDPWAGLLCLLASAILAFLDDTLELICAVAESSGRISETCQNRQQMSLHKGVKKWECWFFIILWSNLNLLRIFAHMIFDQEFF